MKEAYRFFSNNTSERNHLVQGALDNFAHEFRKLPNIKFQNFGKTIKNWDNEIYNSFIYLNGKRLSNGPIECANSKVKTILKNACGIINFKRIIYFTNKCTF